MHSREYSRFLGALWQTAQRDWLSGMLDAALLRLGDTPADIDALRLLLKQQMSTAPSDAPPPPPAVESLPDTEWMPPRPLRLCHRAELMVSGSRVMGKLIWPAALALAEALVDGSLSQYLQIPGQTGTSELDGTIFIEIGAGSGVVSLVAAGAAAPTAVFLGGGSYSSLPSSVTTALAGADSHTSLALDWAPTREWSAHEASEIEAGPPALGPAVAPFPRLWDRVIATEMTEQACSLLIFNRQANARTRTNKGLPPDVPINDTPPSGAEATARSTTQPNGAAAPAMPNGGHATQTGGAATTAQSALGGRGGEVGAVERSSGDGTVARDGDAPGDGAPGLVASEEQLHPRSQGCDTHTVPRSRAAAMGGARSVVQGAEQRQWAAAPAHDTRGTHLGAKYYDDMAAPSGHRNPPTPADTTYSGTPPALRPHRTSTQTVGYNAMDAPAPLDRSTNAMEAQELMHVCRLDLLSGRDALGDLLLGSREYRRGQQDPSLHSAEETINDGLDLNPADANGLTQGPDLMSMVESMGPAVRPATGPTGGTGVRSAAPDGPIVVCACDVHYDSDVIEAIVESFAALVARLEAPGCNIDIDIYVCV